MRSKRGVTEVTKELFEKTVGTFATLESSRWQLYRMGLEAYLLILATWNFARFRYVMRTFKLDAFGEAIEKTKPSFECLRDQSFATVDFDSIAEDVKKIYTRFKSLAEQTGAAKIMHFKSPRLFVMWDTEIRPRPTWIPARPPSHPRVRLTAAQHVTDGNSPSRWTSSPPTSTARTWCG